MAWQDPKEDWNSSDQGVFGVDFNRIEGNTKFLYDKEYFPITFRVLIGETDVTVGSSGTGFLQRSGNKVSLVGVLGGTYNTGFVTGRFSLVVQEEIPLRLKPPVIGPINGSSFFNIPGAFDGQNIIGLGNLVLVSETVSGWSAEILLSEFNSPLEPFNALIEFPEVDGLFSNFETSWVAAILNA